ncbi:MAG: RodZ domain-containing protein [Parcubacteria group bacterium]|jgi:cytoskeletal protein RodZ
MKSVFTKKSVRTLTLGEKLRNLRSERRISLGEVSRVTRIQVKYLEYLEDGEYNKLPVDVYVKGFLRGYAQFLGVDDGILMRLYEKEKGIKNNLEKVSPNKTIEKEKINISPFLITPKVLVFFVFSFIFFGGVFYLYKEIDAFANTPKLIIINPAQNSSSDGNSVVVEGITDKDVRVFINNQPILVSDEGRFSEDLALQSGTNTININAINRFEKTTSEDLIIQSNYKQEEPQENSMQKEEVMVEQNKMAIEVRVDPGPVWVSIETDGNLVFSGTMLTGEIQSFLATEKIIISSGKSNATYIKFKGKEIGSLGASTEPARNIIFDKNTQ